MINSTPSEIFHGLLNTRPYMSHFKAKIKRPVFQKNSTKQEDRELYNVLLAKAANRGVL